MSDEEFTPDRTAQLRQDRGVAHPTLSSEDIARAEKDQSAKAAAEAKEAARVTRK